MATLGLVNGPPGMDADEAKKFHHESWRFQRQGDPHFLHQTFPHP